MKALTVIRTFTDACEGVLREIGDDFTAEDQRAEQLRQLDFVRVEDMPEHEAAEEQQEAPVEEEAPAEELTPRKSGRGKAKE